jgi:hypothetical protein
MSEDKRYEVEFAIDTLAEGYQFNAAAFEADRRDFLEDDDE